MSWSIDIVGNPDDVQAAVERDKNIPNPIKDTVRLYVSAVKAGANAPGAMRVVSMGHYGPTDAWSNLHSFSILPVTLATSS